MVVEVIAVVGRHARLPLLGALEMAQAAIVPAACASMLIASLAGAHAVVHLMTERLPERCAPMDGARQRICWRACSSRGLCIGEAWLAGEYWNSFEETDVLHIPFRPLRMLVTLCAGLLALIFFALRAIAAAKRR